MKSILMMILALGLIVTSAQLALAQDAPAAASATVEGKVTNVDTANNTITVDTAQGSMTFKASGSLPTLSVGSDVKVSYTGEGDNMMADNVEVVTAADAGAAPAEAPPAEAPAEAPQADTTTTDTTTETGAMPSTASLLPLIGFSGLAAFGAALALRLRRK